MRFSDIYRSNAFALSFEMYPPKTPKGLGELVENLERLLTFEPQFVTCTYGAGGSARDETLETLARVQDMTKVPVASHLTCVGSTSDELRAYMGKAAAQGIRNIVAIRGDAAKGQKRFEAVAGGLSFASDLVKLIRGSFPDLGIAVAGYPETHPEAESARTDLEHLKHKVDCGADTIITQLFYANDDYYRFRDRCVETGLTVPIVPGLLPVTNFKQIRRIADLCGARLPRVFQNALEHCGDDNEAQFHVGVEQTTRQAADLLQNGVPGIHFYVLNKSRATSSVLDALNLSGRP